MLQHHTNDNRIIIENHNLDLNLNVSKRDAKLSLQCLNMEYGGSLVSLADPKANLWKKNHSVFENTLLCSWLEVVFLFSDVPVDVPVVLMRRVIITCFVFCSIGFSFDLKHVDQGNENNYFCLCLRCKMLNY